MTKPYLTKVRWAEFGEGRQIYGLCIAGGAWEIADIDWTNVYKGWLLGEDCEGVVACIQIKFGVPFANLEMLFVHPAVTPRQRALIVRDMSEIACSVARDAGAQVVHFSIPNHMKRWQQVVERRRCVPYYPAMSYLRKV